MFILFQRLILPFALLFILVGCADHPVRHLSSDISMIKKHHSTRQDVLTFMGEPDLKRKVSGDQEEWVYEEEQRSSLQDLYVLGGLFSGHGYSAVIITFKGKLVVDYVYRTSEEAGVHTK